ncbi:hypothetical protein DIPPA_22126 [Diplonema papillatum]|nr:hypothetical protein DIPPA_22126 [Diplonema papillatum]
MSLETALQAAVGVAGFVAGLAAGHGGTASRASGAPTAAGLHAPVSAGVPRAKGHQPRQPVQLRVPHVAGPVPCTALAACVGSPPSSPRTWR